MPKIIIHYFRGKEQQRLQLVRLLHSVQHDLFKSKTQTDGLTNGTSIELDVPYEELDTFVEELDNLQLEYEIH